MAQQETTQAVTETGAEVVIKKSGPGALTWRDAAKGGVMAAIAAGLATFQQIQSNGFSELFTAHAGRTIGLAAIGGLVSYLLKNLFSEQTVVKEVG